MSRAGFLCARVSANSILESHPEACRAAAEWIIVFFMPPNPCLCGPQCASVFFLCALYYLSAVSVSHCIPVSVGHSVLLSPVQGASSPQCAVAALLYEPQCASCSLWATVCSVAPAFRGPLCTHVCVCVLMSHAQGAREHVVVYLSLLPVMGGVIINSGGEPLFHALGFGLCMTATAGRAVKTVSLA